MVISLFFFRRVEKAYEAYQEQEAKLSSTLQENLSGVRVVKAFARQEYEEEKFDEENQKKYKRGRYLLLMHALFWPVTDVLCGAQMLAGFLFAGWLTINGEITVGTYLAYAGLVVWIIWPLRNLGRLIVQMSESLVSFGRVSTVVDRRARAGHGRQRAAVTSRSRARSSSRTCTSPMPAPSARRCATSPSRVKPGQSVALIGRDRLGQVVAGQPAAALLRLHGRAHPARRRRAEGISAALPAQQIGIVEQEPFLFSRTVRDNITYGVTRTGAG